MKKNDSHVKCNGIEFIPFDYNEDVLYPVSLNIESGLHFINKSYPHLKKLLDDKVDINIWCRGSSGAILSTLLVTKLISDKYDVHRIKICHIKKTGESSHSSDFSYKPHLRKENSFNIIIDDFISSGNTVNTIYLRMCEINDEEFNLKVDVLLVSSSFYSIKFNEPDSKYNIIFSPSYFITNGISLKGMGLTND